MADHLSRMEKLKTLLLVKSAFRFVWQASPALMVINMTLIVVQGLFPLVTLYLTKLVIDAVAAGLANPDKAEAWRHAGTVVAVAAVAGLSASAIGTLASIVRQRQQMVFTDYMEALILERSVQLDLEFYENPAYYDTLHRAQAEGASRPMSVVNRLTELLRSAISLGAIATVLVSLHWVVGLILVGAALPGVLLRIHYAHRRFNWQRERTETDRVSSYFRFLLTTNSAAKELRIFRLGRLFVDRYRRLRQGLRREDLKMSQDLAIRELLVQALGTVAIFGAMAVIAFQTVRGGATIGDLAMYYQGIQRGVGFLKGLLGGMTGLYEDALFLSNFDEFLRLEKTVPEPANPRPFPRPITTGVAFENVGFSYPQDSRRVLDGVSLHINPGEIVALVGENGAGKTTLVKLLTRLYDPDYGRITIDGIDIREFATDDLRREIAPVFQDFMQFNLSVTENIHLGNVDQSPREDLIIRAAEEAGVDKFVRGLPNAYETPLGRRFSGGSEISVGQWQRIALARALFGNGGIVILDEPTSSQDAKSEYEFFCRFKRIVQGRMALIISHRFSTVRMAHRIYVLQDGVIAESGVHEELISQGGVYARLYEMQAHAWTGPGAFTEPIDERLGAPEGSLPDPIPRQARRRS